MLLSKLNYSPDYFCTKEPLVFLFVLTNSKKKVFKDTIKLHKAPHSFPSFMFPLSHSHYPKE